MTQKKEGTTQPKTAAELREAGLMKVSAEVDLKLFREFKSLCELQGYKVKNQIELAMKNHLELLKKSMN